MTDIFGNAPTVTKKRASKPATGKNDKPRFAMESVVNTDAFVALSTLHKIIGSLIDDHSGEVKDEALEIFVENGVAAGKKPETFIGFTDAAEIECQLRKRSTKSPLKDAEREFLEAHGITVEENVLKAGDDEHYGINPKLFNSRTAMKSFNNALVKAGMTKIDGEPILLKHEATEEVTVWNTTEKSIDEIFAKAQSGDFDDDTTYELIEMVATQSVGKEVLLNVQNDKFVEHAIDLLRKHGIDLAVSPDTKKKK